MLTSPWRSFAAEETDGKRLVMLSYFRLKGYGAVPRFLWNSGLVGRQLERSEGLIGYSVGARFGRLRFYSLSVWRDEEALRRFVRSELHSRVMGDMEPYVAEAEFVRWSVEGPSAPTGWREAEGRMQERRLRASDEKAADVVAAQDRRRRR